MHEVISLTCDLVRFKTMHSRPEEIRRCAEYVEKYLQNSQVDYRRFDYEGVPSILTLPREGYAPIIVMTHLDVVDAPEDLFEPVERDGNLYGRGTLDDKYAAAISMVLLKNHIEELRKAGRSDSDLPFGILITGDEEMGGHKGAERVMTEFKTDFCVALDGGNLDTLILKEKGILRLKLTARGKSAHGSRPWLGVNAIERLMDDYAKVREYFKDPDDESETPNRWRKSLNLGLISGGKSVNQVPDLAEAFLDIRYMENDDVDDIIRQVKNRVECEADVVSRDPMFFSGKSPYLDLMLETFPQVATGAEHGASDARHLSKNGVPGVVWGADGDSSFHSADEHVNIQSVLTLYERLDQFLRAARGIAGSKE